MNKASAGFDFVLRVTGVPTVDTLVAQHLLKTVSAIRSMGADAIISGIRPQIAHTIVHLGIDLQGIATKATSTFPPWRSSTRSSAACSPVSPALRACSIEARPGASLEACGRFSCGCHATGLAVDVHQPRSSYNACIGSPTPWCEKQSHIHSSTPILSRSKLDGDSKMGKYVLGWFLGVPVLLLVVLYMIFH